jgi:hypothetical protein
MGIAFLVRILVMHAMGGDPENRSAFERERAAGRQEILNPFWCFVAAMGQQAMIAHPNAQASRNPPKEYGYQERFPAEHEESNDGANMKRNHEKRSNPIHRPRKGFVGFKDAFHRLVLVTIGVSLQLRYQT